MSRRADLPPSPAQWQAVILRIVAYSSQPQHRVEQEWWQAITGLERGQRVDRKDQRLDEGTYENCSLALRILRERLEWSIEPLVSEIVDEDDHPSVCPFLDRTEWFRRLIRPWFELAPRLTRLAWSGFIVQPVGDRIEGNRLLDRYLRTVEVDSDGYEGCTA